MDNIKVSANQIHLPQENFSYSGKTIELEHQT